MYIKAARQARIARATRYFFIYKVALFCIILGAVQEFPLYKLFIQTSANCNGYCNIYAAPPKKISFIGYLQQAGACYNDGNKTQALKNLKEAQILLDERT